MEVDLHRDGGVWVWARTMLSGRMEFYEEKREIQVHKTQTSCEGVIVFYVRCYHDATGNCFLLMNDNSHYHRVACVDHIFESEEIYQMEMDCAFPHINPIEHVWDAAQTNTKQISPPL